MFPSLGNQRVTDNDGRESTVDSRYKGSGVEVGEGGTSRRRAVGRRSSLPPTKGRAEVRRSKVEGRS